MSKITLKHLRYFEALARHGHFARAAEAVHLSQPALSRSIQALEDELGGPLVDRIGKRNELTPLGHAVLARARRIVHEAAELRQGALALQQGGLGSLRLGLGSGPGAMLMTPWLVYMARHHPGVKVAITRGPTELQLQQLRERTLDALVVDVRRVVPAPDLQVGPVFDMPAAFLCRAGHPLLAQYPNGLAFEALQPFPMASIPLSQEVARLLVSRYGPRAAPDEMITVQCEEIASLLATVEQTDAIYLGIVAAAHALLAEGRLVALRVQPPLNAGALLGMVTLAGRTELPVVGVFREFVERHLGRHQDST